MTFTSKSKYKNWEVLNITDIPDCESKGIYLKHENTGLEVFHLLNSDEENLFSFCFRTPPEDSCGEAHILEHSVLCGSKHFPLKDPFVRLINQSVKTFLNAMTFPDKTVFPASSTVKADYFNLMHVYGDAVFFPNLLPEIFAQEAHHVEIDEKGNYSIQGVVYNEMKGNYSSFDSVASTAMVRSLFPNTIYALDYGGDPLAIPNITHKQLVDFHKKYYRPDNCLVFLYGNIPTEEQLDFIEEKFLNEIEKNGNSDSKINLEEIFAKQNVKPFEKPIFVEEKGPSNGNKENGATVLENWLLCPAWDMKGFMEILFISELLCGHDGSPLSKALLESALGEDISPISGMTSALSSIVFSIGLRGVALANVQKIEQLILKTLNDLCMQGISEDDINAALHAVNFSNREVKRANGPFSLILLRRVLRAWEYGKEPWTMLQVRMTFEEIEKRIREDKDYVYSLIKKYFLVNMHRSLLCISPDSTYTEERAAFEQTLIAGKKNAFTTEQILELNKALKEFQQKDENSLLKYLPHLKLNELSAKQKPITIERQSIKNQNGEIPLFVSQEATNGIVYAEISFMADSIPIEDYPLIPLFTNVVTSCGWGGKSWAETESLLAQCCGNFEAGPITSSPTEDCPEEIFTKRDPVIFRIKMLAEKTEEALKTVKDCLESTDFSDLKRIQDITNETRNDFDESILDSGHSYCAMRAACKVNQSLATDEIWNGLKQLFTLHSLKDAKELSKKFNTMFRQLKEGGAVLHITADAESLKTALPLFKDFASYADIKPPKPKVNIPEEKFYELTEIKADSVSDDSGIETFVTNCEVSYTAQVLPAAKWLTKESAAETVLSHWLSTTILWEELRTKGGAYGAFSSNDPIEKTFSLATYRDPKPMKTFEAYSDCLKKAMGTDLNDEMLEKCIVGCYSKEIQPKSPSGRGFAGFLRTLWGITEQQREEKIKLLFSVTTEDLKKALNNLIKQPTKINVCITNSDNGNKGKIIKLPN